MKIRNFINIALKIILTPVICTYAYSVVTDLDYSKSAIDLFFIIFLSALFIYLLYIPIDLISPYESRIDNSNRNTANDEKIRTLTNENEALVSRNKQLENSNQTLEHSNENLKAQNLNLTRQISKFNYYSAVMTLIERSPDSKRKSPKLNGELTYDAYIITTTYKKPLDGKIDIYETITENRIAYAYFRNKTKPHLSSGFIRFLQEDVPEGSPVIVNNLVNFNKKTLIISNEGDKYLIRFRNTQPCPKCDISKTKLPLIKK